MSSIQFIDFASLKKPMRTSIARMSALDPKSTFDDKFDAIIELQELILDITEANYDETKQAVIDQGWLGSVDAIRELSTTILIACKYRTLKIPLLARFLASLENAKLNSVVLHGIFRTLAFRKPVPLESGFMSFLYHCFKCGIIDAAEIIRRMKLLKKDVTNRRSLCWLLCYFAPEIEATDQVLCQKWCNRMRQVQNYQQFPQIFKNFGRDIDELRANNWELLRTKREFFSQKHTFLGMMRNDDVAALKAASTGPGFKADTRITPTAFLPSPMLMGHLTLLQAAAFFGSAECFKFLLLSGAEAAQTDRNGLTLPQFAVAGGNVEIIRLCQQRELDFFATGHFAVRFHRNEIYEWLKQSVITNIGELDVEGQNVIHAGCESNNLYVMKMAVADGVEPNGRTYHGRTPLRVAVRRGFVDAVELLLSIPRIDLNSKTVSGVMPFHLAAKYGDIRIAKMLLARGNIDINDETDQHLTAFFLAVLNNRLRMVEFLMSLPDIDLNRPNENGVPPLIMAICYDLPGIVKKLIADPRTDVNYCVRDQFTPLFYAIRFSRMYAIEALLKRPEIDLVAKNEVHLTYLHWAVKEGKLEVVNAILAKSTDVNGRDVKGYTALHSAVYLGYHQIVRVLLNDPRTDANTPTENGATALHVAAVHGDAEMVYMLVSRREVDINVRTISGWTPLHVAVLYNNVGALLALMSRPDLDINAQVTNSGVTPLIIACDKGYEKITEVLLTHPEIRLDVQVKKGHTAFSIAKSRGFDTILEMLRARFGDECIAKVAKQKGKGKMPEVPRTVSMEGPSLLDGLLDNDAMAGMD